MDGHLGGLCHSSEVGDGLHGADLLVGGSDGDQHGVGPERTAQLVRVHSPLPVHRQERHGDTGLLEIATGIEDGHVLDGRGDDVPAPVARPDGDAPDREVVGLRGARGEDDAARRSADEPSDLGAGGLEGFAGLGPQGMSG